MMQGVLRRVAGCAPTVTTFALAVGGTLMAGVPATAVPCQCRLDSDCPQQYQSQYCALAAPCTVSSATGNLGICMVSGSNGGGSAQRLDVPLTTGPQPGAASQEPGLLAPDSRQPGDGQRLRR
jgi:hypothetical protein